MLLPIVVLSFCIASSLAEPFYSAYGGALATPTFYGPLLTSAPIVAPPPIALDTKTQYHIHDGFGTGSHGHTEPHGYHHATHDSLGNKQGEFSYLKPDGTIHKTRYIADSEGYRVLSNDLPVGPSSIHHLRKRSIDYQYGPTPVITPSGHLADTPEVAAAKAAHFLEHAKRGNYHVAPSVTQYSAWSAPAYHHAGHHISAPAVAAWSSPANSWPSVAPAGHPTVTPSGYLSDTAEVAQAKAAHFAEKLKVSKYWADNDWSSPHQYNYNSGAYPGYSAIGSEEPVTDTPEVSAAKAAHFAEHSAALARASGHVAGHVQSPQHHPSYYPQAAYVSASGVPADTPEVAHAKAAHLAEYARIASRQKRSIPGGTYPASTLPLPESVLPVVPRSVVLHAHPTLALPYSLARSHLSGVVHSPWASSYQLVA